MTAPSYARRPRGPRAAGGAVDIAGELWDVAVIGAGLSGLVATRALADAGAHVVVLEARDRVGGRTLSRPFGEQPREPAQQPDDGSAPAPDRPEFVIDLGGQWISPTQHRVRALAIALGASALPQHRDGRAIVAASPGDRRADGLGRLARALTAIARLGPVGALVREASAARELGQRMAALRALAATVPPDAPHTAPGARELDARTLADWIAAEVTRPRARELLSLLCELELAAPAHEVGLLGALHAIGAGSGLTGPALAEPADRADYAANPDALASRLGPGGDPAAAAAWPAGEVRIAGGAQSLSTRLAASLAGRVVLGAAATALTHERELVVVSAGRTTARARFAILAVPPALAARIAITPPVSAARAKLESAARAGCAIKCAIGYSRPFWRDAGLSGEAYGAGPVRAVADGCDPALSRPVLIAFAVGDDARALSALSPRARRAAIRDALVALFGPPAREITAFAEHDWSADPWSAGCVTTWPPGVLADAGHALRRPHGRIHYAGTETATHWPHYMEGAVEAGHRAAREVLARL